MEPSQHKHIESHDSEAIIFRIVTSDCPQLVLINHSRILRSNLEIAKVITGGFQNLCTKKKNQKNVKPSILIIFAYYQVSIVIIFWPLTV